MNMHIDINEYAIIGKSNTLIFRRLVPTSTGDVWTWLTENHRRRQWLADGEMTLSEGTEFELVWRNDDLDKAPDEIVEGTSSSHSMRCVVTEIEPGRALSFTWMNSGGVSFGLAQKGAGTVLEIVHKELPDRENLIRIAAGWHAHLDILDARIRGVRPEPFWESWRRLRAEYDQRIAA
ncbi:SRPBCC family protein [Chelativorans sp. SCAU2101]|jgi:Uncharacterized conserved protein|uniref:SRPBCC family protein n=1 Tax=Chelativorans petroleitrophicus TaxID=2975484 RepID=A0A9X2XC84_9HYPH|nr:SRPBCC family protein [Chelativorans petroleitrophicus]MCT8992206.1 SRPBCC family protein [Chelativorans petroleitrophicus]